MLAAVTQNGGALIRASALLQKDKNLILTSYLRYPKILEDIKVDNPDKIFDWLKTQPEIEYNASSRDYILNVSEQYPDAFWNPDPLILSLLENEPFPLLMYAQNIEFQNKPLFSDKISESSMDLFI